MRPGWNPALRNRNAGTKAHGHGEDNRLVIPESRHDHRFYPERLHAPVVLTRDVVGHPIRFLVEPTHPGWFHPCTVDDVCRVLAPLPPADLATFDIVVMRQSTRKQRVLAPAWGRAIFAFDTFGFNGAAIVIESQDLAPLTWDTSMSPEQVRELDRLRDDGHQIRRMPRHFEIDMTRESLRNTVLYRTLLHEVGHHIDRQRHSLAQWDSRTHTQKEDFAHRYADAARGRLRGLGIAPFEPLCNVDDLRACGLTPGWFLASQAVSGV